MRKVLRLIFALAALGVTEAQAGDLVFRGKSLPGNSPSWQMYARLTPDGPGRYRARIEATNASCVSRVEGVLTQSATTTKFEADQCALDVKLNGKVMSITERECSVWHGANCNFEGTLRQSE